MNEKKLYTTAQILLDSIQTNKQTITEVLITIESYTTIKDEMDRVTKLLRNIDKQAKFICSTEVNVIATYLPQNQPLYAYFLFGVIPSLMSKEVYIRPPLLLNKQLSELSKIFSPILNNLNLYCGSRSQFFNTIVSKADVIIFTGKYRNVKDLIKKVDGQPLVIFNGSGLNPIIISETADLEIATTNCLKAQTYNSGQDCMAPMAIFVHKNIYDVFTNMLIKSVSNLKVGDYTNKSVDIGPLLSIDSFKDSINIINNHQNKILCGGEIDHIKKIIYPTIIEFDSLSKLPIEEIYAPIYRIVKYSSIEDIKKFLLTKYIKKHAAYISYFGQSPAPEIDDHLVLLNKTIESLDDGNEAFGGYGIFSSFIFHAGCFYSRPILISKEIAQCFSQEDRLIS